MVTNHDVASLLFDGKDKLKERHVWSVVSAVHTGGHVSVKLNPSVEVTCPTLCNVAAGDRVLVLIHGTKAGHDAVIIGKAMS